jgi:hypothetical protein
MAGLNIPNKQQTLCSFSLITVFAIIAAFVLGDCSQSLTVKNELEQKVADSIAASKGLLALSQGTTVITNGGTFDLGHAVVGGSPKDTVFTIKNSGGGALGLNGNPVLGIGGTNGGELSLVAAPQASIAIESSTTFTLRFTPTSAGSKAATITLPNDAGTAFTVKITATGDAVPAPSLTLLDGSMTIGYNGTATWPNTIYKVAATKTLTLKNDGTANLTFSVAPNTITINGGAGQGAYSIATNAMLLTLTPGSSTTFSATFTPTLPDITYPVVFTINSNDSSHPAFTFNGSGLSTQWHGRQTLLSDNYNDAYPQLTYLGGATPTIYSAYEHGGGMIYLQFSADAGDTWTSAISTLAPTSDFLGGFSIAASSSNNLHIFYYDSSSGVTWPLHYLQAGNQPSTYNEFNSEGEFAFPTDTISVRGSTIAFASGNVYVVAFNSTTKQLSLNVITDAPPEGQGEPSFTSYPLTQITINTTLHTGGDCPSIQTDGTNAYITYLDSITLRWIIVPLSVSKIGTNTNYTYGVVYTAGSIISSDALAIDTGTNKAYLLFNVGTTPYITTATNLAFTTWSTPSAIAGEECESTPNIELVRANSALYSLWTTKLSDSYAIRFGYLPDGGSWNLKNLDTSSLNGAVPTTSMVVSGLNIYVSYSTSTTSGGSIMLMKSLDGGATW